MYIKNANGTLSVISMTPNLYLWKYSNTQCYIVLQEETDTTINFWLLGDNFLQGYYQVYDIQNKAIGLASSSYIINNQYTYNTTVMYVNPGGDGTSDDSSGVLGLSHDDLVILIIAVCAGGSILLSGALVCICCYIRMKKRQRMEQRAKEALEDYRSNDAH